MKPRILLSTSLLFILSLRFIWFGSQSVFKTSPELFIARTSIAPASISSPEAKGVAREIAEVQRVVDGDTIELTDGRKVGYIGIDTPETIEPKRPVCCFGKEASNKTKSLLTGKKVILQKDVSDTDKYGRLLRYVFLPLDSGQTLFVNDYLVREGYARVYTYPPDVKYNKQFLDAERQAREANKGLWGGC